MGSPRGLLEHLHSIMDGFSGVSRDQDISYKVLYDPGLETIVISIILYIAQRF